MDLNSIYSHFIMGYTLEKENNSYSPRDYY